jgi:hypothetical protein
MTDIAQVSVFLGVVCSVIIGVSRRAGDFIMGVLFVLLSLVFWDKNGGHNAFGSNTLSQIPFSIDEALSRFDLDGRTTTYAVCPKCHCTYEPHFKAGSDVPIYPERCSFKPTPEIDCDGPLLERRTQGDKIIVKLIKTFVYHHFHDYVAGLVSQHEAVMDKASNDLKASARLPPPSFVKDPFEAEFMRTFKGPDKKKLFVDGGDEGRYAFAANMDFFNVEGMRHRGASTSCGIISAACVNLPLSIRYLPENMYLGGVIPGPKEPHLNETNHYLQPLIKDLAISWERGHRFSRTLSCPNGRTSRCALAIFIADLPAARKAAALSSITSNIYCSVCHCHHKSTYGRTDWENWDTRNTTEMRKHAEAWQAATSSSKRDIIFKVCGVRWSVFWILPYWDPVRQLVVDSMHCILEGLAQYHARTVLGLTTASALTKREVHPAFTFDFKTVDDADTKMTKKEIKHVMEIHKLLEAPIEGGDDNIAVGNSIHILQERLMGKNMEPLKFVGASLGCGLREDPSRPHRKSMCKADWVTELLRWVSSSALTFFYD